MDTHDKSKNGNGWWRGNFPLWIVVILLSLLAFFLQREVRANDERNLVTSKYIMELRIEMSELRIRIAWMEQAMKENKIILERIDNQVKPLWRP